MERGRNIMVGLGMAFGVFASVYLVVKEPDISASFALVNLAFNLVLYGILGLILWLLWRAFRWLIHTLGKSRTVRLLQIVGVVLASVGGLVLLYRWLELMRIWFGFEGILLGLIFLPGEILLPFIFWTKYGYVASIVFWPWLATVVGGVLVALGRSIHTPEPNEAIQGNENEEVARHSLAQQ